MKKYTVRVGVILLLALLLVSGCTRAKSGPPEPTAPDTTVQPATQPPGTEATSTPGESAEDSIAATTTAWARETATAAAVQGTEIPPRETPEPGASPEPTGEEPTEPSQATGEPEETAVAQPTVAPQPVTPLPSQETTHTVQAGENLFRIALQYGLGYQRLASYNGIANPNFVYVGQVLRIPPSDTTVVSPPDQPVVSPPDRPGFHVVQPGENLFRIALRYNMPYTTLARANGLSFPYTIYVGQRLTIP